MQPGAEPKQIRLAYEDVKRIEVDSGGDLVLTAHTGAELRQQRPRVYQEIEGQKVEVASKYRIAPGNHVSFELARYDRSEQLLIDLLVLVHSTYVGGSSEDEGLGIALDGAGWAYVTGRTYSANFPTQLPYQVSYRGGWVAFVTEFEAQVSQPELVAMVSAASFVAGASGICRAGARLRGAGSGECPLAAESARAG